MPARPVPNQQAMAAGKNSYFGRLEEMVKVADATLRSIPLVVQASDALQMRPVMIPCCFLLAVLLLVGLFDAFISQCIGFFYPALQSFKAIETKSKDDDTQWLTYWIVYGLFCFMELFSDVLLFWIPFYYLLKVAILLWLSLPQFRGAHIVYERALRPALVPHLEAIGKVLDAFDNSVAKLGEAAHTQ